MGCREFGHVDDKIGLTIGSVLARTITAHAWVNLYVYNIVVFFHFHLSELLYGTFHHVYPFRQDFVILCNVKRFSGGSGVRSEGGKRHLW